VIRYLRLFAYFARFSASRAMEFRMDLFFRIIMDVFYYSMNIAFYKVLFLHAPSIGGWNEPEMMIFVAGYLFTDAVCMTFFVNNQWMLPTYVNRGDLDYYLTRPVSSLFFLTLRDIAVSSFVNLLITVGILVWAFMQYPAPIPAAKIALFMAALCVGILLQYCISTLSVLPVFWTHSIGGLRTAYWSLARFAERPDRLFQGWARRVLTILLPFCVIASFPTRLALEEFDWRVLAHLVGITGAFFGLLLWVWRKGLRSYSSASS
jgi:ABC-2 type transport system permease protein